jgi:hypothetical protein
MTTRTLSAAAVGALLIFGAASHPARAWSDADHREYLTFSGAVAIPGAVLPAGTYIFEVVSPSFSNTVVCVRSRDGRKIYLTQFARIVERQSSGGRVTFHETRRGEAPAVDAWYPMGGEHGRQFIYN